MYFFVFIAIVHVLELHIIEIKKKTKKTLKIQTILEAQNLISDKWRKFLISLLRIIDSFVRLPL